jgi:hypothetical protein
MALDIYIGSLTRYHVGNWENAGTNVARQMGTLYWEPEFKNLLTNPRLILELVTN